VNTLSTVKLESFSGTHYEIGFQQGKAVRELLHQTFRQISNFPELKSAKPRLIPISLFLSLAKRQAIKKLKNDIPAYYPKQAERMKGIAEGADVDLSWIFLHRQWNFWLILGHPWFEFQLALALDSLQNGQQPMKQLSGKTLIFQTISYH